MDPVLNDLESQVVQVYFLSYLLNRNYYINEKSNLNSYNKKELKEIGSIGTFKLKKEHTNAWNYVIFFFKFKIFIQALLNFNTF